MHLPQYQHWHLTQDAQGILWCGLDVLDKPMNVLAMPVLEEFSGILEHVQHARDITACVFYSEKSSGFIAGADVQSFQHFSSEEDILALLNEGQRIFQRCQNLSIPTVAVINGVCLGGGLELALVCKIRIAVDNPKTEIGLPEVRLGLHPGWGGSVRLPRLIGSLRALPLIVSGKGLKAKQAYKQGIVHAVVPERQWRNAARYYIKRAPKQLVSPSPLERLFAFPVVRSVFAWVMKSQVAKKMNPAHYPAPFAVIDTWSKYGVASDHAYLAEAHSFAEVALTPTARNLLHIFLARQSIKRTSDEDFPKLRHIHVIGPGVMGGDIAAWCAFQGFRVSLQSLDVKSLQPPLKRAHQFFKRELVDSRLVNAAMDRLIPDPHGDGIASADLIIEAVFEDLSVKQSLFKTIEEKAKPDAIIATNTSSILLSDIRKILKDPSRLVGMHFFNPATRMALVEVVRDPITDEKVVERTRYYTQKLQKLPIMVSSSPGFFINRVIMAYLAEAFHLLEEGFDAREIDHAAIQAGMPMGPLALVDQVGADICLAVAEYMQKHYGGEVSAILKQKVTSKELGVKTGVGFYTYRQGKPIDTKYKKHKVGVASTEMQNRLILRLLNEVVACLAEGVVASKEEADIGLVFGTGFSPFLGGPLQYIQDHKLRLLSDLSSLKQKYGERFAAHAHWSNL